MAGHVLFIDHLDNEIMELKLGLEAEGIQVTVQPNPKQAIDDAKVNVPDLVVIEVLTRPVGGLEFGSTIAFGKHGFRAPVIFYTAFYRDERARRDITEKYGALHYFVKPFQREALKKAIWIVFEQLSHSRNKIQPQSRIDVPQEVLPSKPVEENQEVTQSPIPEPVTPHQALLVQSPSTELPPAENELASLQPFKKEPEVEREVKAEVPPVKVTALKLYPKSPKVWAKDDKTKIQTPPSPEKHKPNAPLRVDPKVSPKPKDARTRVVLPPRPVKKWDWNWAMLTLLVFVSVATLYFIWHRFGQLSPNRVNDPPFESSESNSSDSPPIGSTPGPAEGSHENGPMVHKSAAKNSTKTPSAAPAQVESPSKLPSEPGKETPGQNNTHSPRPELVVSDISISIREPQLVQMKKIVLSDAALEEMGGETFVVRVVIDGKGRVREVTQLKKNTAGASLPQDVLATIWEWEFRSVAKRQGEYFIKHYSFKVASP